MDKEDKKIYLNEEFTTFWNKITNKENFALLRYGDGERAIMTGKSVKAQEGWISPNSISQLGSKLLQTLNLNDKSVFYGISCPCCDQQAYYWYKSRIISQNITFANLFVNSNYKTFINKFNNIKRDAIFIGNHRALNNKIGNLNILKYYLIDDDCINFYENKYTELLKSIKNDYGNQNDLLYVISAGPLSEAIIYDLYINNPNNCYIDFGSSIDKYIHNKITRPYMKDNSNYAKLHCWMYKPDIDMSVSVVLSTYKRPEVLEKQLKAIEEQTLKPKEILLFQDGINGNYSINFSDELIKRFNNVEISQNNKGVWARFDYARKNAKSQYVCVFDDDTIPGNRWLENCMNEMLNREGLYGTIGILCKQNCYKPNSYAAIGWRSPNDKTLQVDFAGHSWFLKKDWLNYLFDNTEDLQKFKICGEDMTLSAQLQKHNILTFVPPHPTKDLSYWGSIPDYAHSFGNDKNSLFVNNGFSKMTEAFDILIKNHNFQILKNYNKKKYCESLKFVYTHKYKELLYNFVKSAFSIKNEYKNYKKYKIIRFLGIKISIKYNP